MKASMGTPGQTDPAQAIWQGRESARAPADWVPAPVMPILSDYLELISKRAPDLLRAFYLIGSIGLNAFEAGQSDLDFAAVLSRPPSPGDIRLLRAIHRQIAQTHTQCKMDGTYWQGDDLPGTNAQRAVRPRYGDGKLRVSECRLSPVDGWLLAHHAIVVFGPEPPQLGLRVKWESVTKYMIANLSSYWLGFTRSPVRLAWLLADSGVQWTVLGISRLWYAFQEGDLPAKVQAGEYLLARAPGQWKRVLTEGLALRRGHPSAYRSRLARAREVAGFVGYAIQECNARYGGTVSSR
jgi:hypothetical protein